MTSLKLFIFCPENEGAMKTNEYLRHVGKVGKIETVGASRSKLVGASCGKLGQVESS